MEEGKAKKFWGDFSFSNVARNWLAIVLGVLIFLIGLWIGTGYGNNRHEATRFNFNQSKGGRNMMEERGCQKNNERGVEKNCPCNAVNQDDVKPCQAEFQNKGNGDIEMRIEAASSTAPIGR